MMTDKTKGSVISCVICDILLVIAVSAAISGLWRDSGLFLITFLALPFLGLRFLRFVNNRIFYIVWLSVLAGIIVTMIICHAPFGNGFKLLANQIFDIGEMQQGYVYDRFDLPGTVGNGARLFCAFIFASLLAMGIVVVQKPLIRIFVSLGLFAFTVFICAFFGIEPVYIAMIGILVFPVITFISGNAIPLKSFLISAAVAGGVIALISIITFASAPAKNFAVSETEEQLRDFLAGRTVHFANLTVDGDKDDEDFPDDNEPDDEDDPYLNEADIPGETGGSVNGRTLLFIILAIIGILLLLFIPARFLDKVRKKREKNKAGMDSEDNSIAIRSHFMYLMRWFKYKGWFRENEFFKDCADDIGEGINTEYADYFKKMHLLWQEAAFSGKPQSDGNRQEMETFVNESVAYLWDQAQFGERMKIRFRECL